MEPKGFTLEELQAKGAKPVQGRGFTLQELQQQGAKPLSTPLVKLPPEKSFREKAASFLGIEKFGKGIGSRLATSKLFPEGRMLQKLVEEGKLSEEEFENLRTGGISGKEFAGSGLLTALNLGLPFLKPLSLLTKGKKLKTLAQSAGIGSTFGAASGIEQGKDIEDVIKDSGVGAVFGLSLPVLGAGFALTGRGVKAIPRKLYNQIFKAAEKDLKNQWTREAMGQPYNKTLAEEYLSRGIMGTNKGMFTYSAKKLYESEQKIKDRLILSNPNIKISSKKYIPLLEAIEKEYAGTSFTGTAAQARKFKRILERNKNQIDTKNALAMRRFLDGMRTSSSFKLDPRLSKKQEDYKIATDQLRRRIANKNPKIAKLLEDESVFIRGMEAIIDDAVKRRNSKLLNFTDIIVGGGGMATGFVGSGIGAAAAIRGFQRPGFLTAFGQGLQKGIINPVEKTLQFGSPKFGTTEQFTRKTGRQLLFGGDVTGRRQ